MLDTSGIQVSKIRGGKLELFFCDYCVEEFGGNDYESTFILNRKNAKIFCKALKKIYSGTLQEMVEQAFGKNFSVSQFNAFCNENKIKYTSSNWC